METTPVLPVHTEPDTSISFEAVKRFENGELNESSAFTFDVSEVERTAAGETLKAVATGTVNSGTSNGKVSEGTVRFDPITYSLDDLKKDDGSYEKEKTFRYVIRERIPSGADENGFDSSSKIKYDTKDRYATVTLKLSGSELKASVAYDDGKTPVFTNTKNPPTPPPGENTDTGDRSGLLPFAVLMLLSLGAAAAALGIRRRKA